MSKRENANRAFWASGEKVKNIYEKLNNTRKDQFGSYRKSIFHLHTPASYDYRFLNIYKDEHGYKKMSAGDIFDLIVKQGIVPEGAVTLETIKYDDTIYCDIKEYLSFFVIASYLIKEEIEMVVVTDHNTINGYHKLSTAVQDYWKFKRGRKYPEILCGIEVSCADKNHVVGIFDINKKLYKEIEEWIEEYIMSEREGTYLTSVEILNIIFSWNGIGYIAHIDTSDIFKKEHLSQTYKKKLFSLNGLEVIGVNNTTKIEDIKDRISHFSEREFNYVVDEDSHSIEEIGSKAFWIKGIRSDFSTIRKAIRDYNISVELHAPLEPEGYIKGLYVIGKKESFLIGNKGKQDFFITFSNALNCFIGGRGTGKSTVLQLLDFTLGQNYLFDDKLELICANKEIWILYNKSGIDYLVLFNVPVGQYETLDSAVEQMEHDFKLFGGRSTHEERVQIQKKYIQIFRVRMNRNVLEQKEITRISEMLSDFFDTKYSINELVQFASTNEISNYIKNTIQKNRQIPKMKTPAAVWTLRGLENKILAVRESLVKRKVDIEEIISAYNNIHKKDLQITYSFHKTIFNVIPFEELFRVYGRENRWFYNLNIKWKSVCAYFERLHELVGTLDLLEQITRKEWKKLNTALPVMNYTEMQTFRMVETETVILSEENVEIFFKKVENVIFLKDNISILSKALKNYVANCELYNLMFNVNHKENVGNERVLLKSISRLSMGQKVVAMLSFVLSYSDFSQDYRPLIIDQPEDNLDNQYIYKNLVKQLREIKSKRQIIIATHNATIVTNAKAEQVVVMESDNEHGWIKAMGYPNDKRIITQIVNNLEGGKESFKHKCFIYADVIDKDKG